MKARIREVFWQIVRREKIRRRGPSFQALARQDREALREILDAGRTTRSSTRLLPGLLPRTVRFSAGTGARRGAKRRS